MGAGAGGTAERARRRDGAGLLLVAALALGVPSAARAADPGPIDFRHTRNEGLAEQVAAQLGTPRARLLPQSASLSLAADLFLYKPFGLSDITVYHGNGYWLNTFAEYRPHPDLALNFKLSAYNPASSFGYVATSFLKHALGFSWAPSFMGNGTGAGDWHLRLRYFDLDRQDTGAGLLLEDKEVAGMRLDAAHGAWRYRLLIDGTGAYFLPGEFYSSSLDWGDDRVGLQWAVLGLPSDPTIYDVRGNPKTVAPWTSFFTLYSRGELPAGFRYRVELGAHGARHAALGGVSRPFALGERVAGSFELQHRWYETGFAEPMAGFVVQDYVTPEIEDKPFTDPRNILARGDGVQATSFELRLDWRPAPWLSVAGRHELIDWRYRGQSDDRFWLFKQAFVFFPYAALDDSFSLYVSNRSISGNVSGPTNGFDRSFVRALHYGIEAFLYF
jgi:hypothetical protein